jgi:imidazolonepropionase-like amidohydrolase
VNRKRIDVAGAVIFPGMLVLVLALLGTVAAGGELLYFEAGTVWTGTGETHAPGSILVRDGEVLHVGPALKVAPTARKIVVPGAYIVPAFVDAHSYLGIKDADNRNERLKSVYPEFKIADCLHGSIIPSGVLFEEGVMRAYVSPGPGAVVAGLGAVIDLGRKNVVDGLLALSVSTDALSTAREPIALSGVGALLRERVPKALGGRTAVRVFANRQNDVETALSLAREHGVRAVLLGVERPDLLADLPAASDVILIPRPTIEPVRLKRIAAASERGVRVAFASWADDAWHVNVRFLASVANAYGLSHEAALRALTVNAAEACGLAGGGTIEIGGRADFSVFAGDPLDLRSPLLWVVADGAVCYASDDARDAPPKEGASEGGKSE